MTAQCVSHRVFSQHLLFKGSRCTGAKVVVSSSLVKEPQCYGVRHAGSI